MLRISTQPGTETSSRPSASGVSAESPIDVGARSQGGPREWTDPIAGRNHAAQLIPWITNELRFHSVIDLACGDGEAVRALIDNGYEAHGVDIAPRAVNGDAIIEADAFDVPREAGYYDLAICANFVQEIADHRVTTLLAEMNRLSNSYVLISTPEEAGSNRTPRWWCDRIADFGWQIRLLRQDPDTRQIVLLAEKENSLAAQVLPLLDAGVEAQPEPTAESTAPASTAPQGLQTQSRPAIDTAPAISLLDDALATFEQGQQDNAYLKISDMAHAIGPIGDSIEGLPGILDSLVTAMERRDTASVARILRDDLRPALAKA